MLPKRGPWIQSLKKKITPLEYHSTITLSNFVIITKSKLLAMPIELLIQPLPT